MFNVKKVHKLFTYNSNNNNISSYKCNEYLSKDHLIFIKESVISSDNGSLTPGESRDNTNNKGEIK